MTPTRYLRADVMAGLLDGWVGPIEVWRFGGAGTGVIRQTGHWQPEINGACYTHGAEVRLDLHRPEVQDHLARWLAAHGKPAWHLLDSSRTNALPSEHVGGGLGWSVMSVARGGGVLRGVYAEWCEASPGRWERDLVAVIPSDECTPRAIAWDAKVKGGRGWKYGYGNGPETGEAGRARANAAAHAAGFATIDGATVTYPELPDVQS